MGGGGNEVKKICKNYEQAISSIARPLIIIITKNLPTTIIVSRHVEKPNLLDSVVVPDP